MIPDDFFEYFFDSFSLEEWRRWFEKHPNYQDYCKGFRVGRAPKKVLKKTVLRLLKEHPVFQSEALELWEEEGRELWKYSREHVESNLSHYLEQYGREKLFWLLMAAPERKFREIAEKLLKEQNASCQEASSQDPTGPLYTEEEVKQLQEQAFQEGRASLQRIVNALQDRVKELAIEREKYFMEVVQLEEKLEKHRQELSLLRSQFSNQKRLYESQKRELEKLREQNIRLASEFPSDFTPCSLVTKLEARIASLEKALRKITPEEKDLEKEEERKRQHAELLQRLKVLEEENQLLRLELEHQKKQIHREKKVVPKPPVEKSSKSAVEKIHWPREAHHYPKRLESFLERLAQNPYVEDIYLLEFENTAQSRVKSRDKEGGVLLVYSDGEKGVRILLKTTAKTKEETLFVEQKLEEFLKE